LTGYCHLLNHSRTGSNLSQRFANVNTLELPSGYNLINTGFTELIKLQLKINPMVRRSYSSWLT